MDISAEHRSKFAAIHLWWWRLQMTENLEWDKLQTNKQTNNNLILVIKFTSTAMVLYLVRALISLEITDCSNHNQNNSI